MSKKPYRDTRQRLAIRRAIDEAKRPLGPKEILESASQHVPNLGIATVYRNIKVMVEEGKLETIELPGQPPRYSPPNGRNRALFLCHETDRVFALPDEALHPEANLPDGFEVERKDIIYYGRTRGVVSAP